MIVSIISTKKYLKKRNNSKKELENLKWKNVLLNHKLIVTVTKKKQWRIVFKVVVIN